MAQNQGSENQTTTHNDIFFSMAFGGVSLVKLFGLLGLRNTADTPCHKRRSSAKHYELVFLFFIFVLLPMDTNDAHTAPTLQDSSIAISHSRLPATVAAILPAAAAVGPALFDRFGLFS